MGRLYVLAVVCSLCLVLTLPGSAFAAARPAACPDCWRPSPDAVWQYQLQGRPHLDRVTNVYVLDHEETKRRTIDRIHDRGAHAVCYFNAGAWERWRSDRKAFPKQLVGKPMDGWPGERWLDIRAVGKLMPIMKRRMRACKRKGFDAVDPDNVNGYSQRSGFPLRPWHQIRYNRMLANAAHRMGLAVGLKNDGRQVARLVRWFDFAVIEQCFQYRECGAYMPFVRRGKAAVDIEYRLARKKFCGRASRRGIVAMRKKLDLRAWRRRC